MRFLFIIYVILTRTLLVSSIFKLSNTNSFNICFTNIANKYLNQHTNIFLGPKFEEIDFSMFEPYKIGNSTEFLLLNDQETAVSYSVSYSHIDELNDILTNIGVSNAIYYIIIANDETDVPKISRNLWELRLYKSVILLPEKSKVKLYEIDLKNSKCGIFIKPRKINECTFGKFKKQLNLFNRNMKKSFSKCPIRIIWSKYAPWVFDNNETESGIYREILAVFEEKSSFNIIYMPENEVYTEELSFYNFGSIIADFDNDYADVFIGLVGFSASSEYVWTTGTIYEDDMYFVVPNPRMIPHWMLMYKILSPSIWLFSLISSVTITIVFTLLALNDPIDRVRYGYFADNCIYLFSLVITVGYHKLPRSLRVRIFLGIYLVAIIISVVAMQGRYVSITSHPLYEKRISNVEQLLDSDVPVKCSEGLRLLFMYGMSNPKYSKILQRMENLPSKDLSVNLKRAYNENFATVTDTGLLIMNPHLKRAMQVFKIYSFVTCFLVQKNHVLYEHITKNLTSIVESGFVDKFVSELKFKYSRQQYFNEENRLFRYTLTHLEGSFFILTGGYVAALLTFVLEHIYFYRRTGSFFKIPTQTHETRNIII